MRILHIDPDDRDNPLSGGGPVRTYGICKRLAALERLPELAATLRCRGYEVWTPLTVNRLVDISDVIDLKLTAIGCYASQLKDVDYRACVKGLNAYRSLVLQAGKRYAEAFWEGSVMEYRMLSERAAALKREQGAL